ncbi:hypothetical protein OZX61_06425 [Acinetobacter sp. ESL0695]|uniref:hypothetical protein n=1 Tax=Acinetobacter sp. ESL0695 TaxID=2983215 RepID=UPI0023F3866C|nr:hypothetical protein [Acinetobacter sp. ESL0695]WEV47934.1 hypothetical protein OZX61_06425 [Acinetobacter sp. ESL0695]
MSTSQQGQKQPHLLLNLTLITLETFYSFIFKNDDLIKRQSQTFIEEEFVLKVNSYIPYVDFYVYFTKKGILFDTTPPKKNINLEMSSTIFGYFQTLVLGNSKSVRAIKLYGETAHKDQMRDLLLQLSIPRIASDWKNWLSFSKLKSDVTSSQTRTSDLLDKIDYQRVKIDNLQIEVKQYKHQIRLLKAKQKRLILIFLMIIIGLCGVLIYNWI